MEPASPRRAPVLSGQLAGAGAEPLAGNHNDAVPEEDAAEMGARLESVRKLEREVAALEQMLLAESRLNRKVEIRRILKSEQATLAALLSPSPDEARPPVRCRAGRTKGPRTRWRNRA